MFINKDNLDTKIRNEHAQPFINVNKKTRQIQLESDANLKYCPKVCNGYVE